MAIDDPWENDQGGRYALSRTALSLATVPNILTPVLMVTSRVTRISDSLIYSRKVLAIQPGKNRPILEVALHGGGGARTISRYALEALGRLDMDYSILKAIATRSRAEQLIRAEAVAKAVKDGKPKLRFPRERPDQIWPVLPKNRQFPIGVGTGMHHLRVLNQHILNRFQDLAEPLVARATTLTLPHRPTDPERVSKAEMDRRKAEREAGSDIPLRGKGTAFPEPASITAAVKAAGFTKLRLVCLWYRDETRLRMLTTLAKTYNLDNKGLDPRDGQEIDLYGGTITAVFHFMGDFLTHGSPSGRTKALKPADAALDASGGVLVGAWCETHIPTADDAPGLKPAELEDIDAKPQTKTILAGRDIASQYVLGKNAQGVIQPKAPDHPTEMALLDLYRSLGIIDDRIANALRPEPRHALYGPDRIAHVGFHIRQQNKRKGERTSPKIVVTATALVPPAKRGDVWQLRGWSSAVPRWQPYRSAQNQFHANQYPQEAGGKKSYRHRWDDIGAVIERALEDLVEELDGRPYVVTVDEDSARRIWDGLQNSKQSSHPGTGKNKYWLPGYSLQEDERPDAIIRVNIADDRVPPPVAYTRVLSTRDGEKEGETTNALYEIETDFGTPVWLLCNVPRNYDGGNSGRLGAKYTRWDAKRAVISENREDRRKSEMPEPWYTMTATEIFPIALNDRVSHEALAFATAQLCHQTMYWSGRARYPVALHAAIQMDEDHPQYRRTAQSADEEPDIDEQE
ncbi:RNaseH domain-containing protein [Micromonospora sonchi]|uniref:RNaseH domain-containing protein n=1 Tax=Micromonospora sonchi TaxID=1763543 RepID=UPI00227D6514|nr:RNaseH domain-containing protein [Micromonospora sonchi]